MIVIVRINYTLVRFAGDAGERREKNVRNVSGFSMIYALCESKFLIFITLAIYVHI